MSTQSDVTLICATKYERDRFPVPVVHVAQTANILRFINLREALEVYHARNWFNRWWVVLART
jgi:hypothetical protein